jgi:pimeloyl-ACP methyl ester carboxylesterase
MPYLNVGTRQLYYETHGEGETIILLHHGFGCAKMWAGISPALVEAGYRVVLYDRRGYGRSEPGENFEEFYLSDAFRPQSMDELAQVKAQLSIGPCHLVGQCEGGVIAADYAARYPDDVKSLVTSSTQCFSQVPMVDFNPTKFPKAFQDLDPEVQEKFHEWHGQGRAEFCYDLFRRFGGAYGKDRFDLRDTLQQIVCPALVIYPDRSSIFDVEQGVAFYKNLLLGELLVLPDCGHNTYQERPEEYVAAILDFQRRLQSPCPRRRPQITCAA